MQHRCKLLIVSFATFTRSYAFYHQIYKHCMTLVKLFNEIFMLLFENYLAYIFRVSRDLSENRNLCYNFSLNLKINLLNVSPVYGFTR